MANLNQVNLIGNATGDPELKTTQSGLSVCEFSMAVNDRVKRGDQWVDEACFIDVTLFGKSADWIGGHLTKGGSVLVEGRLKFEQWERDGQKRSKHKVVANRVQLLGSRTRHEEQEAVESAPQQTTKPTTEYEQIPF